MTNLEYMLKELQGYKRDKNELISYYIQKRLDKSLENYYNKLIDSFNFVKYKNEVRIARKLKEVEKENEK